MRTVWRLCEQFGGCANSLEVVRTVWRLCEQFGGCANSLNFFSPCGSAIKPSPFKTAASLFHELGLRGGKQNGEAVGRRAGGAGGSWWRGRRVGGAGGGLVARTESCPRHIFWRAFPRARASSTSLRAGPRHIFSRARAPAPHLASAPLRARRFFFPWERIPWFRGRSRLDAGGRFSARDRSAFPATGRASHRCAGWRTGR